MLRDLRASIRFLVRELRTLNDASLLEGVSFRQCHLLMELDGCDGCSLTDLCDALVLEKSTVSRLVSALKKKALIVSEPDPADGRAVKLRLTLLGRQRLAEVHRAADQDVLAAAGYLSADELRQSRESFARYAKALRYARINADWTVRPIERRDSAAMGAIIRQVMTEFGAVGCGYSIEDPEVDDMYAAYANDRSAFWVVANEHGQVVGGAGIGPLVGGPEGVCELKKMYFLPEARGRGLAARLIRLCLDRARELGYESCYLETLDHMHQAQRLYRRMGFQHRDAAMGNTGHFKCNTWMVKDLNPQATATVA